MLQSTGVVTLEQMFLGRISSTGALLPLEDIKSTDGKKTRGRKQAKLMLNATNKRSTTVGAQFKNSLVKLVDKMTSCRPHFIRCIKPNTNKSPWNYQTDFVLTQLRYTGVLETTRIRREGYSVRPLFAEFIQRYRLLAFGLKEAVPSTAVSCKRILQSAKTEGWLMGTTKVFLKYFHLDELDEVWRSVIQSPPLPREPPTPSTCVYRAGARCPHSPSPACSPAPLPLSLPGGNPPTSILTWLWMLCCIADGGRVPQEGRRATEVRPRLPRSAGLPHPAHSGACAGPSGNGLLRAGPSDG